MATPAASQRAVVFVDGQNLYHLAKDAWVDLVRMTYERLYHVAIIVSQDWDFGAAVALAKEVAKDQGRQLEFESAFPCEPGISNSARGVPGTTWVHIRKAAYDACHDPRDYRPRLRP